MKGWRVYICSVLVFYVILVLCHTFISNQGKTVLSACFRTSERVHVEEQNGGIDFYNFEQAVG